VASKKCSQGLTLITRATTRVRAGGGPTWSALSMQPLSVRLHPRRTTQRIPARTASIGAAEVRRVLPHHALRQVGPWVLLDHFGPKELVVNRSGDVVPHPQCGISTVSFLFSGQVEHRDSAGGHAVVAPALVRSRRWKRSEFARRVSARARPRRRRGAADGA
jgi:hypothetical protein